MMLRELKKKYSRRNFKNIYLYLSLDLKKHENNQYHSPRPLNLRGQYADVRVVCTVNWNKSLAILTKRNGFFNCSILIDIR
jgi:hypothetical protein